MNFSENELNTIENAINRFKNELEDRLDNYEGFGPGIKENYEDHLKQCNNILDKLIKRYV